VPAILISIAKWMGQILLGWLIQGVTEFIKKLIYEYQEKKKLDEIKQQNAEALKLLQEAKTDEERQAALARIANLWNNPGPQR
jgi:hypothetical protein